MVKQKWAGLSKLEHSTSNMDIETLPCQCIASSRHHVESCSFSPGGDLLAACFGDYSVRLLRITEQTEGESAISDSHAHSNSSSIRLELYWVIKGHKANVWCVRFSPDGRLLCTCSSDKTAKLWDVRSRTLARCFDAHSETVWSCCFSPSLAECKEIAVITTGSSDKTVKVWNAHSGAVLCDLVGYGDAVDGLSFSVCGDLLCTSCRNGVVKVWSNLNLEKRLEISQSFDSEYPEPVCRTLVNVNNSPSRFCMFSSVFPHFKGNSTAATDASPDLESISNINELLFVGGPNHSILVWSMGDILGALCDSTVHDVSQNQHEALARRTSTCAESANTCDVTSSSQSYNDHEESKESCDGRCNDSVSLSHQEVDDQSMEGRDTGLEAITEVDEKLDNELQHNVVADRVKEVDQEDGHDTDDEMESAESSADVQSTEEESSQFADEEMFYSVKPRWTLTGHLNTVWDCCTAVIYSPPEIGHELMSGSVGFDNSLKEKTLVLASCSSDRTLRFWKFAEERDSSASSFQCIKVFQLPGSEHKESQILTCASRSTNQLLAIGLYNGSLHLADLSNLCLSIQEKQ